MKIRCKGFLSGILIKGRGEKGRRISGIKKNDKNAEKKGRYQKPRKVSRETRKKGTALR